MRVSFSLRQRLLSLIVLAVLPAIGLLFYHALRESRLAAESSRRTVVRMAGLAADNYGQFVRTARMLLEILARVPLEDKPVCGDLLEAAADRFPEFDHIAVFEFDGRVRCGSWPLQPNLPESEWFREALAGRAFSSSGYLEGRASEQPLVIFASSVLDDSARATGILALSLDLARLSDLLARSPLPEDSVFAIVDHKGSVLAQRPDGPRWVGKTHPLAAAVTARQGLSEPVEHADPDGLTRVYAFAPLGDEASANVATLVVGTPRHAAYREAQAVFRRSLLWISAVTVLVLALAWAGTETCVLKRVRTLTAATRRLAAGDLMVRTGIAYPYDEIGQLGGAFDQMAKMLQQRETERTQAERTRAQLAAIVESSSDAIISRTLDGLVTSWNRGAELLYGYSAEEMIGRPITVLMPPEELGRSAENFERIRRGERIRNYETVRLRKDGARIQVSVSVSPIIDDRGNVVGAASITRDIGHLRRAENEIRALHDINVAITSTLELPRILDLLLEKIDGLLPYAASHIRLVDPSTGAVERLACRNIDHKKWQEISGRSPGPRMRALLQSGKPFVVSNTQTDPRVRRKEFYRDQGLVSQLGVPLTFRGEVFGLLSVFTREEHDFTEQEIAFMRALADLASIAIHNSRLYENSLRLSQELAENEKQIRALIAGLISARDEEARRIASVLHDESGQLLATVYIALDELARRLPDAAAPIRRIKATLDQVEERLRDLSHELHPTILDHLGLLPGLEFLAQQISRRSGIDIAVEGLTNGRFSPLLELTLYRAVQEALNNAAKHSGATRVHVRLIEDEGWIQCSVQDNGVGFDASGAGQSSGGRWGLGLAGIRERLEIFSGSLQVFSCPGAGTKLLITIPQEKFNGAPGAAR